ncbi:hypothetical protein [Ralstonia pseudosolanacearum]
MTTMEFRSAEASSIITQESVPLVRERELLRVAADLAGIDPLAAVRDARREILKWANQQIGDQLPEKAAEGLSFEHLRGGRTCIGVSFQDEHRDLWALRVDRPDTRVAQRTWTTEVVVGRALAGGPAMFSLRLLVSTPEEFLAIEPAVPGLVRQVATTCGLQHRGASFDATPWNIASQADAENLVDALVNTGRSVPYLVCSIANGDSGSRLNTRRLAKATLGIARVVVVPANYTWVLTQRLGKPLSVYRGAARAYMPGFSYDANPYAHRLFFVQSDMDEGRAKSILATLSWLVANGSLRHLRLGEEVVAFSLVREASLDFERKRLKEIGYGDAEQLQAAQSQIEALKEDLKRAGAETDQWIAEYERSEEQAQHLEQQFRAAQYRIQQLVDQIKARGDKPDVDVTLPDSWDKFADWCDEALIGRVKLSGRARRETKSADFESPQTAARCLLWLANEYRDSRINGSNSDLRKTIEEGIHNDRCGSDAFDFNGRGDHPIRVEWHIKNGGNTRDPRRCLRIYYFWDEEEQSVVVATMPAHIPSGAS